MRSVGTFKTFAFAASLGAVAFSPVFSGEDTAVVNYRDSYSSNWREYNSGNASTSAYTGNAEIRSIVGFNAFASLSEFEAELGDFWDSLETGSIFDEVGPDVWALAKRIVAANPDVADFI